MPSKLTTEDFIKRSILKHGERYDYSKSYYISSKDKLTIICKLHGEFKQTASDHYLSGCGCPKCDSSSKLGSYEFINRSNIIHNGKYDYSLVNYGRNNYDLVHIICNEHGVFKQRPWAHLRGQGCPKCSNNTKIGRDKFIEKSKSLFGDNLDYSLVEYKTKRDKVSLICKKHGIFEQKVYVHLAGHSCPKCRQSKLESYLANSLDSIKELYEQGKRFETCRNKLPLPFDFYLPFRNILIECDGIQHSKVIDYFGGVERFEYQKNNDSIKEDWCFKNSIKLVRLRTFNEIDSFINELKSNMTLIDLNLIKDLKNDRIKSLNNSSNYLIKSDFNYYNKSLFKSELSELLIKYRVDFRSDFRSGDLFCDFQFANKGILLVDYFEYCEINKNKDYLKSLKDGFNLININLVVIYIDDWFDKFDVLDSRIRNLLGLNIKIGARECDLRILDDNKLVYDFMDKYHIQGGINSGIKLGLFHKGELVSIMTFGKLRRNLGSVSKDGHWELLRFCTKSGITVVGSANRFFNFFIKNYKPLYILSYADRCWTDTNSNVYSKMGMTFISKTSPSYTYIIGHKRFNRFKYRKDKLVECGYDDGKWTERSICLSNTIFKIWDCGCLKFEWKSN